MFIIVSLCLYSLNSLSLVLSFSPPPHTIFMCVQFVVKSLVVGGPFLYFFSSRFLENERERACVAKFLQVQI